MSAYHIWHPAYVRAEPLTLEVFLTQGDALLPPAGGQRTAAAVLGSLGLDAVAAAARLRTVRSAYFGSYRGTSADWRDAWSLVWPLQVVLDTDRAPAVPRPPAYGYVDLDTAAAVPGPGADRWNCLVIADAPTPAVLGAAREVLERAHPEAELLIGRAFGRYPQLRCDLGERDRRWYEAGAPDAEPTLAALARAGAGVRFDRLLG